MRTKRTRPDVQKQIRHVGGKINDSSARGRQSGFRKKDRDGEGHANGGNHENFKKDEDQQGIGVADDLAPNKNNCH